jgi:hypothetical protein
MHSGTAAKVISAIATGKSSDFNVQENLTEWCSRGLPVSWGIEHWEPEKALFESANA